MKKILAMFFVLAQIVMAGDGTLENPYTCAEAIANNTGDDVWVEGYIIGVIESTTSQQLTGPWTTNTNIALADSPDETATENILAVQLKSGTQARTDLNLVDHPENWQQQVKIEGDLMAYYSRAGHKNSQDYVWSNAVSTIELPFVTDFEDNTLGQWTAHDLAGSKNWVVGSYDDNYYASMTNYQSTGNAIDWLVSPAINFNEYEYETLNFISQCGYQFGDYVLELKYSTDYDGTSDPTTATWTDLVATFDPHTGSGYGTWTESGDVDLTGITGIGYIAFVYDGGDETPTWNIDNINITNTPPLVTTELPFVTDFEDNTLGEWRAFDLAGSKNWIVGSFDDNYYASMTNYQSTGNAIDWLVSPSINFDNYENERLTFVSQCGYQFSSYVLEVKYSNDYDGTSDPTTATWTDLVATFDPHTGSGYGTWTASGNVSLADVTGNGFIAFVYDGGDDTPTWNIDDISIVEVPAVETANLYINEVCAENTSIISDENGEYDPWFEIYNGSDEEVELMGHYISDEFSNPTKWNLIVGRDDYTEISPKGFALFFADGESGQGYFHNNTVLNAAGQTLYLFHTDGVTLIDSLEFGAITTNKSFGRVEDGDETTVELTVPTPARSNTETVTVVNYVDFEDDTFGDWTAYSEGGSGDWEVRDYSGNKYAQVTAYNNSGDHDDWLISPAINLDNYQDAIFSFLSKNGYDTGYILELKLSQDYAGTGSPLTATWEDVTATFATSSPSGYGNFEPSGDVDLSTYSGTIYLAFRYFPEGNTTTWQVDDLKITGKQIDDIPVVEFIYPFNNQSFDRDTITEVNISAHANDPADNITSMDLYIDGALVQSYTSTVFEYAWDISQAMLSNHEIKVVCKDNNDNEATRAINVSVYSNTPLAIHDIQGDAHVSPLDGQTVTNVQGIVTGVLAESVYYDMGFYMQTPDADIDANPKTSEGIFVRTGTSGSGFVPNVVIGDLVEVTGTVDEMYLGGFDGNYLSRTELAVFSQGNITVVSQGNELPANTVLGTDGLEIPQVVIDNDTNGEILSYMPATFDPEEDGLDLFESIEFMRVQINSAKVVAPTYRDRAGLKVSFTVVPDNGDNVGPLPLNDRSGIVLTETDNNPERISVDDELMEGYLLPDDPEDKFMPDVTAGATFNQPLQGIFGYFFLGDYKLYYQDDITLPDVITPSTLLKEYSSLTGGDNHLTVASFNVENLSPMDSQDKFDSLAIGIVSRLNTPDILCLAEVQDNSGPTDDGVVVADSTYAVLINSIENNGGPVYSYAQIDPENNQDGGAPGANIRVGFLYNPERVTFNYIAGGDATTPVEVLTEDDDEPTLSFNPGRIDPQNTAFGGSGHKNSRKPIIGEFEFNEKKVFVIAVHFSSKSGDDALYGRVQPPVFHSVANGRLAQVTAVRDLISEILEINPAANVIAAGDFNDFHYSEPMHAFTHNESGEQIMNDLIWTLPENERYTYNWSGNMQALDHVTVSNSIAAADTANAYDIVHMNSEFYDQVSDHDPELARLYIPSGVGIDETLPKVVELYQNYPNPFNPQTTIAFNMPTDALVKIDVYNYSGQHVQTLVNGKVNKGIHKINFDASRFASGIYYYTMKTGNVLLKSKKMLLIK